MSSSMLDWFLSTLTPTPTESHMPTTAEIIQKCLNVNPFDLKFREANLQHANQSQEQGPEQRSASQLALPTTPGITMLKLPSSLQQSPNIFSNLNALAAADLEGEFRKTMDITRKVQQLRENANFVKQEGNRTPCTADVLNAVLDMNMNQMGGNGPLSIPSTSSLVAGLSAAAAAVATANNQASISTSCTSTAATNSSTSSTIDVNTNDDIPPSTSNPVHDLHQLPFNFPRSNDPNSAISQAQAGLAATTAAVILQQQTSIANMISHHNALNALNNQNNHSMPNLHAGFQSTSASNGPASNGLLAPRASPALSNLSPRSTSHLLDLHKTNNESAQSTIVDPWETNDVKPLVSKPIQPYSMYESGHGRLELNTNIPSSESSTSSQPNSQVNTEMDGKPHRKYTRYHNPSSNDSQMSTSRGGRGRRSLTSEMPPDERRMTILERNKAAAVRYRKRKKEEHDEMIGRVHGLEQDKVFLQTQNNVLRREVDRLTELLKMRDARCICRAASGLPIFNNSEAGSELTANAMDSEPKAPTSSSGPFMLQPQ